MIISVSISTLTVRIRLSVHSRANCLARRVTSSDASAIILAVAINSRLLLFESECTNSDRRAIRMAIRLAAAISSLSCESHCRTS